VVFEPHVESSQHEDAVRLGQAFGDILTPAETVLGFIVQCLWGEARHTLTRRDELGA
jgi:hypothetical protein